MPAQLFGVTMSTGVVRGATVSDVGELLEVTERPVSMDRALDNACDAALELAAAAGHDAPVMAVGGDPEDWVGRGGVRLVGECDAFLAAARVEGCVEDARVIAVVDVGRVGTRIHVLDNLTGRLISSVGTDEFSGDALTMAVTSYLWSTYGAAERGGSAEMSSLAAAADRAIRLLGTERAVDLSGPFVTDPVRLRRNEFDAIVADCAARVQPLIDDAVRVGAEVVLLVGGCAESAAVVDVVAHRTDAPVRVPRHPAAFSAMGAAHLSTVIPAARLFAAPRTVPAQRVPVAAAAPVETPPAPVGAHAAPERRRSPRIAAVAGTAALVAVATLGAAAGASERGPVDVRATDRVVATSGASIPDATPAQTRPQGVGPAPTSTDTTTATTAPTLPVTDIAGTVTPPPPVTPSTDPRQPTAAAPSSGGSTTTGGTSAPGRPSVSNGGGGRDAVPTRDRDRDDDPTPRPTTSTSAPGTPATTPTPPAPSTPRATSTSATQSATSAPRATPSHP